MTDDDRNEAGHGFDLESEDQESFSDEDAGDPAAAFDALRQSLEDLSIDLRREMTTIRKGVEAAFDQFEKIGTPVDYRADLGNMLEQIEEMTERVQGIEKSPLLRHGPDQYAREFTRAGEALVRTAAQQFEQESRSLRSAARDLVDQADSARDRKLQDWWLLGMGSAGIVLGVLLVLFVPRVFPNSVAPYVASTVMGNTAWEAGMGLLSYASPGTVQRVADADKLVKANNDAVADCREAAGKADKEQKCTIIVPVPEKAR